MQLKAKDKRRTNESYPEWLMRLYPNWSCEQRQKVCAMLKAAWFDGLKFEREVNNNLKQINKL